MFVKACLSRVSDAVRRPVDVWLVPTQNAPCLPRHRDWLTPRMKIMRLAFEGQVVSRLWGAWLVGFCATLGADSSSQASSSYHPISRPIRNTTLLTSSVLLCLHSDNRISFCTFGINFVPRDDNLAIVRHGFEVGHSLRLLITGDGHVYPAPPQTNRSRHANTMNVQILSQPRGDRC